MNNYKQLAGFSPELYHRLSSARRIRPTGRSGNSGLIYSPMTFNKTVTVRKHVKDDEMLSTGKKVISWWVLFLVSGSQNVINSKCIWIHCPRSYRGTNRSIIRLVELVNVTPNIRMRHFSHHHFLCDGTNTGNVKLMVLPSVIHQNNVEGQMTTLTDNSY